MVPQAHREHQSQGFSMTQTTAGGGPTRYPFYDVACALGDLNRRQHGDRGRG